MKFSIWTYLNFMVIYGYYNWYINIFKNSNSKYEHIYTIWLDESKWGKSLV
jgi:hypothetical protein